MQVQSNDFRFPVALERVFTQDGQEVPRARSVVRLDNRRPLSIVSDKYQLYTHEQVMDAVDPFISKLGIPKTEYHLEKEGARLIATHTFKDVAMHLPAHGTTDRALGDVVGLQVHVINSYNAKSSLEFKLGGLVLRCLNGMTIFDGLFNLNFRHFGESWDGQLPRPELVLSAFKKAEVKLEEYANRILTHKEKTTLIEDGGKIGILPRRYFERERSRFESSETAWDLYNSFTYVASHSSNRTQYSGKLTRYDRLNVLFENALNAQVSAA